MIRLSREQVRRVDQICIDEYGLPGIVLMENAARSAFLAINTRFAGAHRLSIGVVCGGGNNGGDGYALARHLYNRGHRVELFDAGPPHASGDAATMRAVAKAMQLPFADLSSISAGAKRFDLWIDALYGTGLSKPIGGLAAIAIDVMNGSNTPIVAIDLPSGLDCDSGEPMGETCVRAKLTVTFAAEKIGFVNPRSVNFTGDVVVGTIGCPYAAIESLIDRSEDDEHE